MIKVIYMLKIYAKQNGNFELVNGKVQAQSILMIRKFLLKTRMVFITILENINQIKNVKV